MSSDSSPRASSVAAKQGEQQISHDDQLNQARAYVASIGGIAICESCGKLPSDLAGMTTIPYKFGEPRDIARVTALIQLVSLLEPDDAKLPHSANYPDMPPALTTREISDGIWFYFEFEAQHPIQNDEKRRCEMSVFPPDR